MSTSTSSGTQIQDIVAWEALDSRGTPTVACEVVLRSGARGSTVVPSGASTGRHEAHEMRDGDDRYAGRGVAGAVANVEGPLAAAVRGRDASDQESIDRELRAADGSPDLSTLGANAVLSISIATALATAAHRGVPLYMSVSEGGADGGPELPMPMVNIISGGAHAGGAVDVQDFLVVPLGASSFREAVEWVSAVRRHTAAVLRDTGHSTALVADEGGLAAPLSSNRAALEILTEGITRSGLAAMDSIAIAIDVAATQLFDGGTGRYRFRTEDRDMSAADLVAELRSWTADFPIVSVEDALAEDDWAGWRVAAAELGDVQLLGDDLFATDPDRLHRGIAQSCANAVLVKPNQIGTLTDAHRVIRLARGAGFATVLSARSGDTEDSWLADLAVGWRTGQIKVGSTMRSERTAKWNRLLAIEAHHRGAIPMAGRERLAWRRPA